MKPSPSRLSRPSCSRRRTPVRLLADTRGLSTVEYIIILCLIAVVGFALWKQFGQRVEGKTRGATTVVGGLPTSSTS
jgi:Flp pilus assembly pilin Flp